MKIQNNFIRNNEQLKAPDVTQYVDQATWNFRMEQMKKISQDILYFVKKYFYIVSLDEGKVIIKPYPKQAELVVSMTQKKRLIVLATRQCGKSTSYSMYVLWYCITNKDKAILICANKQKTSKDILARIKLAYEMLPSWLKPGVVTWNTQSIEFSNGCKVTAEATSQSSGRGGSINMLILDEFAFLKPNLQEGFMSSVFPVVSSSKNSQIIIVSTPNGMNNEYYKIWNKAKLNINNDSNIGWYPFEINWWDVPGRDEEWKQQQLASFHGNIEIFNQEYGNSFLGSISTLVRGQIIKKYKDYFEEDNKQKESTKIQLHKDYPSTNVNIYYPPQKNRAYIVGADPSTGSDNDYQALTIWDITNTFDIKMVASFYQNDIPPKIFAYIICKLATIYNKAYVAMENNGVSYATLDYLFRQFEYENVIHLGGNPKTDIGISSQGERKFEACMNFKQIIENPLRKVHIYDGRLIDQMERFERHNREGKTPKYYATSGHDDLIMCSIWALYILKPELLELYYNINQFITDKFGREIALFVTSAESIQNSNDVFQYINELDQKFKNSTNYDVSISDLEQNIQNSSKDIIKHFEQYNSTSLKELDYSLQNNNDLQQGEPNFDFAGFFS